RHACFFAGAGRLAAAFCALAAALRSSVRSSSFVSAARRASADRRFAASRSALAMSASVSSSRPRAISTWACVWVLCWSAATIANRLAAVGFPRGPTIRIRLFSGMRVSLLSAPKPTVALMQSRRRIRPGATSPSRSACSASVRRAVLKAGSRAARAVTVSRKSLVRGMARSSRAVGPFALFVVAPSFLGGGDVAVLPVLLAAAEEKDQLRPVEGEIDPVAGSEVDSGLMDAFSDRLHVRLEAGLELRHRSGDPGGGAVVQGVEPRGEGAVAVAVLVLTRLRHEWPVSYMLLKRQHKRRSMAYTPSCFLKRRQRRSARRAVGARKLFSQ